MHPYLDGVYNPRDRTFRISCFNSRKLSPVFTGGPGDDEVNITEVFFITLFMFSVSIILYLHRGTSHNYINTAGMKTLLFLITSITYVDVTYFYAVYFIVGRSYIEEDEK